MAVSDRWDIAASSIWSTSGEQASSVIENTRSLKFVKESFGTGSIIYKLKSSFGLVGKNWARHRGVFRSVNAGSVGCGFGFGVLLNAFNQGYWFATDTDNFGGETTGYLVKGDHGVLADLAGAGASLLDSFPLGVNIFSPQDHFAFELVSDRDSDTGIVTLTARFGQAPKPIVAPPYGSIFDNLTQVSQVTDSTYSSGTVGVGASSVHNINGYEINFDVVETWVRVAEL